MKIIALILFTITFVPLFAMFLGKLAWICQRLHSKIYPEAYRQQLKVSSEDELILKRLFSKKYEYDEYYNPPIRYKSNDD